MNNIIDFDITKAFILADKELILDTYEGFETINPVGKGYFVITNQRFIYLAVSKDNKSNSIAVTQWNVDGIGGMKSEFGKRVNMIQFIIASLILILAIGGFAYTMVRFIASSISLTNQLQFLIPTLIAFVISILLFVFSKRKMFNLEVLTKTATSTLVSFTSDFFKSPNQGKIIIKPTSSTFNMIKELGKSILNAQNIKRNTF